MAFSFGTNSNAGGTTNAQVNVGADVPEIDTEGLGFAYLSGEKKLKLLQSPWPTDDLPPSSSSLLSVASKKGLLAAAGPDALIMSRTENVRNAILTKTAEHNIVKDFRPELSISQPRLSHVAFSSSEEFLVITAENGGGLAVYDVEDLLQGKRDPACQIATDGVAIRALVPNPSPDQGHLFAIVLDQGQLMIADLVEQNLKSSQTTGSTIIKDDASCVTWSAKGKQLAVGLTDGTVILMKPEGESVAVMPRPADVGTDSQVTSISWLSNDEFFIVHCPSSLSSDEEDAMQDNVEIVYHFVETNKARTSYFFSKLSFDPCYPSDLRRGFPPKHSILRLREWSPMQDMLILAASNTTETAVFTKSTEALSPDAPIDTYVLTGIQDTRRAQLPQATDIGDSRSNSDGDTLAIGAALDLSSKDLVDEPIAGDREVEKSATPLPALFILNNQGLLCAWWIVYNKSVLDKTGYQGLTALSTEQLSTAAATATAIPQVSSTAMPSSAKSPAFSLESTSAFGGGSSPSPAKPSFGTPSFGKPSFGKPSFGKPSFGMPSQSSGLGATPAFGSTSGLGNQASSWASAANTQQKPPSQAPFSKFAASDASSKTPTASPFSSFGGGSVSSPFSNLGKPSTTSPFASHSPFGGKSASALQGVSTEPSFGSTVTVGSSTGGGSTLPSWANTPANQTGSIFGGGQSSFASTVSTKESSTGDEGDNRGRDEATPTPQAPPQQSKGLFGMDTNKFQLDSSFKGDGSAKDDLPKPMATGGPSMFGADFTSALGSEPNQPVTPNKITEHGQQRNLSTTPGSPPPSQTPAQEPPKATEQPNSNASPPGKAEPPLPPDFMTTIPKKVEEDLPPLAGSPAVQVEAPESSVPSSPLSEGSDEGREISVEEQDDEYGDQTVPQSAFRPVAQKSGWSFQDSVNPSPHIPPQAPTPPIKSEATSRSRNQSRSPSRSPVRPHLFGQTSTPTGFPKPQSIFPPPPIARVQDSLRSPSPVRSASTSALGNRRQPHGATQTVTPLTAPSQQPRKPPTPAAAPEVSDLSDDEAERIRQELQSDIQPNRLLDPFIAHQDYIGSVTKQGVPGQIERLYRDINSMIDTLGLNARSLAAFIKYNTESRRQTELDRNMLDEVLNEVEADDWDDQWLLSELEDLMALENDLQESLEADKITNMHEKLLRLSALHRDLAKLDMRVIDLKQQITNRRDPEMAEVLRLQPLPKEQAEQQRALRSGFATLLKDLSEAEEGVFVLKSKLATRNAERGKTKAIPTVGAVKKTIFKLTSMVEKKNSDIDVLESQMRRLGMRPNDSRPTSRGRITPARNINRNSVHSVRVESPFATPPTSRSKASLGMSMSELSRRVRSPDAEENGSPGNGYGLFYTPEGTPTKTGFAIQKWYELDEEDLKRIKVNRMKRTAIANSLMDAVERKGIKETKCGS